MFSCFFFFNDTATTEIYTLSLHDALPILQRVDLPKSTVSRRIALLEAKLGERLLQDRKSTRLNSSHSSISYAVFCLKKKKHGRGNRRFSTRQSTRRTKT